MSRFDLLPPNATPLERDFSRVISSLERAGFAVPQIRTAKRLSIPDSVVPWLVYEYGLAEILSYVTDERRALELGIPWQRIRGTPASIIQALSWIDITALVEESEGGSHRWAEYQLGLSAPTTGEAIIDRMTAVARLSTPVRSRLQRIYSVYDVRQFILDDSFLDDGILDDHSGVRPRPDWPQISYGDYRAYSVALASYVEEVLSAYSIYLVNWDGATIIDCMTDVMPVYASRFDASTSWSDQLVWGEFTWDGPGYLVSAKITTESSDVTPPTVSSIVYGTNDGNLSTGETITLIVTFSEVVVVTGTPTIALNTGGTASYTSGSGSNQLIFTYTPLAGHSTADLATAASSAFSGTIKDNAGNSVVASGFDNVNPAGIVAVNRDPYFSNRKLLLHMDGSNNSTTFTDSSSSALTVTATNAIISTAQSKFGGASGYFNGSAFIAQPAAPILAFGSGDFTVEFWIYPTTFRDPSIWYDSRTGGGTTRGFVLGTNGSGQVFFYSGTTVFILTSPITLNQWRHIAAVRTGTTIYLFIDGVQAGTNTCANVFTDGSFSFGKTNEAAANYFVGYADELRASNRAEYTSNFTPPSVPFPNA